MYGKHSSMSIKKRTLQVDEQERRGRGGYAKEWKEDITRLLFQENDEEVEEASIFFNKYYTHLIFEKLALV